jgi:hypothetical protein
VAGGRPRRVICVRSGNALAVSPAIAQLRCPAGWSRLLVQLCSCAAVSMIRNHAYCTLRSIAVMRSDYPRRYSRDDGDSEALDKTFHAHRTISSLISQHAPLSRLGWQRTRLETIAANRSLSPSTPPVPALQGTSASSAARQARSGRKRVWARRAHQIRRSPADLIPRLRSASAARSDSHLGSARSDRRVDMPVANAVLTTVVDTGSRSWTPRCPSRSSGLLRWPAVDLYGPGHSPEKRKVGGSTPPLTTTFSER